MVLFAQGVMFYGFGILFPAILEEFNWSRALTSSIFSVHIGINSLFILIMGYLIDKYSPRLLITFGVLFLVAGLILSSFTQEIWHLYLYFGIFAGVGTSSMYLPPITVVTRWFEKKRGLALGITVTGIGIGGFLGSPFLSWAIETFGWRTALIILGILLGIITLLASMVILGHPEDKDLRPYGSERSTGMKADEASQNQISMNPNLGDEESYIPDWPVWQALKTGAFFILFLLLFFAEMALLGVMAHLFTYSTENGLSKQVVSWAYSVIGVTSLIGKVGIGSLSDRIGRKRAFLLSFLLQGTAFIFLFPTPNIIYLFLFASILGLSYGGWTPLFPATVGDFFGLQSMGKIYSILALNFFLGGTFGPILAGWMFDKTGSYHFAFIIFCCISYLGAVLSLFLKPPKQNLP